MDKPTALSISDADWQQTPVSVQGVMVSLWAEVKQLRCEVGKLREQVEKTSRNSSRPPSSDPPSVEKPARRPSGRPRGGQPGHEGHGRRWLPVEQVDEVVPVKPSGCRSCGADLSGEAAHPFRHQVTEIPPVRATVTEYQLHTLACSHCQTLTEASLPEGVPSGAFGPRVQALTRLLSAGYRLSKRKVQLLLSDAWGVSMSLGSVRQLEQTTSAAVAPAVEAAKQYIQGQEATNLDETGWKERRAKAWLWTAVTQWVTVFVIRLSRGSKVVRELLKVESALWTFVYKEGVEPTNNAAEQAVRHGVLWRKSSFGTQSATGSRFAERMMTVIASLRQQQRNVLDYLTQACQAALLGQTPPSLLPKKRDTTLK